MEKAGEMIETIKERLANPFLTSFLISWLVYNWRITVGLVWYDTKSIQDEGYTSLYDLISTQIRCPESHYYPALAALGLSIGLPFLRIVFGAFDALMTRIGNSWFFGIMKNSSISTSKYLDLRDAYLTSIEQLEKVIKDESNFQSQYQAVQPELIQLRNDSKVLAEMTNENFLQGRWEIIYTNDKNRKGLLLVNSSIIELTKIELDGTAETFVNCSISLFFRDIRGTEKLIFQIRKNDGKSLTTYSLNKAGNLRYVGTEDFVKVISFTKVT